MIGNRNFARRAPRQWEEGTDDTHSLEKRSSHRRGHLFFCGIGGFRGTSCVAFHAARLLVCKGRNPSRPRHRDRSLVLCAAKIRSRKRGSVPEDKAADAPRGSALLATP